MAKGGGSHGRGASPRRRGSPPRRSAPRPVRPPEAAPAPSPQSEPDASGPFVLGAIPGATPGKWIDAWNERMPRAPLQLRTIPVDAQRDELMNGGLDAAIVRLPLDRDSLHVIALYDEVAVAVVPADSHLTVDGELRLAHLAGETLIVPLDDVLGTSIPGAVPAAFDQPATTADAVALVATGVGVSVMPMSLARLHARRDVASVPLRDGPVSTVALAWSAERNSPAVDVFVGIVRGRTPRSSRT